jgi:hypothetical protein
MRAIFFSEEVINVGAHLLKELVAAELVCMSCDLSGSISIFAKSLTADVIVSTDWSPKPKKTPDTPFCKGFRRAASAERDRASAYHGFDRHHPEIFLAGKDQRAASRVMLFEDIEIAATP